MIKCPHCGMEFDEVGGTPEAKWYHNDFVVAIALLSLGPFALRIVWKNPRYNLTVKWIITLVIIAVTIFAVLYTMKLFRDAARQFEELGF